MMAQWEEINREQMVIAENINQLSDSYSFSKRAALNHFTFTLRGSDSINHKQQFPCLKQSISLKLKWLMQQ